MSRNAVFLNQDGGLLTGAPYSTDPNQVLLCPGVGETLRHLAEAGYELVVITRQPVGQESNSTGVWSTMEEHLRRLVRDEAGVELAGFYSSPRQPGSEAIAEKTTHSCGNPDLETVYRAATDLELDLTQSWLVGDYLDAIEAGRRAGCRTILVNQGNEIEWCIFVDRQPHFILSDLEQAAHTILAVWMVQGIDLFHYIVD